MKARKWGAITMLGCGGLILLIAGYGSFVEQTGLLGWLKGGLIGFMLISGGVFILKAKVNKK